MYRICLVVALLLPLSAGAKKVSALFQVETPGIRALSTEIEANVILDRALDDELIQKLEAAGATIDRLPSGKPAAIGKTVGLHIAQDDLDRVAALPEVVRIEPAEQRFVHPPLRETAPLVGATAAWNAPAQHPGYTGEGVVIADIETSWDILHPDFFRPDAGGHAFEDVDGDGVAGPGDRVDLDGDGVYESELKLYSIPTSDRYRGRIDPPGTRYAPAVDWLFVDLNGNGTWDAGKAAGFTDDDPAFGEPIFVGDDLDGDGAIRGHERLLRLGTSKVRSVHTRSGLVYRRGNNLSAYRNQFDDLSHGTSAAGVAAGGWAGIGRRYVGLAPSADLVFVEYTGLARDYATVLDEGVDVLMVELSQPLGFLDGSSAMEEGLTELTRQGVTVVTATGNFAGENRTARFKPEGQVETIRYQTDSPWVSLRDAWLAITWIGDPGDVQVVASHGEESIELKGTVSLAGMKFQTMDDASPRGTAMKLVVIRATNGGLLPSKELALQLQAAPGVEEIRLLTADEGVWGPGTFFVDNVDDGITAIIPATADDVIGVGAFVGRRDMGGLDQKGAVTYYSGNGPRIDGEQIVDLLGPDDPITASWASGVGHEYAAFGGTSAALPHVTAAAALVKDAFPHFGPAQIREALRKAARQDSFTGVVPNHTAGFGKLDVARAIFGEAPVPSGFLGLRLESAPAVEGGGLIVRAVVESPEASSVVVEFDVGWDGLYEVSRSSVREVVVPPSSEPIPVVARAFDSTGQTTRTVLWVDGINDCHEVGCEEGCCRDDGSCGSCDDEGPGKGGSGKTRRRSSGGCSAAGSAGLPWLLLPSLLVGHLAWAGAGRKRR